MLTSKQRKSLRQIAHHLEPVVTVGERGLTESVVEEVDRALRDHELIKVRVVADREARSAVSDQIAATTAAEVIQRIGKVIVLYKENPQPNPKLSNLSRYT